MVTFKLKEENDQQLVYWYFPHGNEENGHGTIVIDRVLGKLDVTELAPDDRLVRHTVENQNRWRKAVNQMRNIEQIPELSDEEWPEATEDQDKHRFCRPRDPEDRRGIQQRRNT